MKNGSASGKGGSRRYIYALCCTTVLLVALGLADAFLGGTTDCSGPMQEYILVNLRLPRVLTALLAGAALALCGIQMQGILANPLADPHIMGVSGGAGLGAAIATAAAGGVAAGVGITLSAFIGAALTSLLLIVLSTRLRRVSTLLIFGVMLGFIFSAITSVIEYSVNEESLKIFYGWSAGSFTQVTLPQTAFLASVLVLSTLLCLANCKGLDIIGFSDEYALAHGASPVRIRIVSLISCCLAVSAVTSFCGPIGFVGIVAPHIARKAGGTAVHLRAVPLAMLTGGCITLAADLLSNIWRIPLPVGSTVALIGIPVVIYLLFQNNIEA